MAHIREAESKEKIREICFKIELTGRKPSNTPVSNWFMASLDFGRNKNEKKRKIFKKNLNMS